MTLIYIPFLKEGEMLNYYVLSNLNHKTMKTTAIITIIISTLILIVYTFTDVKAIYEYERKYSSYWELADKSSTIQAKSEYIDKFTDAIKSAGLQGKYNAIIYKNFNNSFDANFTALKTLQTRLKEIKGMNVSSFEYQQAIQQITAQEQGEAHDMLATIHGAWLLDNYILLWNWIATIGICLFIIILAIGFAMLAESYY